MYELIAESLLPREHAEVGDERDQVRILPKLPKRLGKALIRFRDDAVRIEKDEEVFTGGLSTVVSPLRNRLTAGPRRDHDGSGIFCPQFYGSIGATAIRDDDLAERSRRRRVCKAPIR
jgi:hypothetical protein